jgi:hypothetical protein
VATGHGPAPGLWGSAPPDEKDGAVDHHDRPDTPYDRSRYGRAHQF